MRVWKAALSIRHLCVRAQAAKKERERKNYEKGEKAKFKGITRVGR